jgi:iron(III) transport system permease protein
LITQLKLPPMRGWSSAVPFAILLGAATLAVICFIWPTTLAICETIQTPNWADAALSARRMGLLLRGLCVAAAAAGVAQILGAGLAAGLTAAGQRWRTLSSWVCLVVLLTPPYIYAFAWSLLLLPGGSFIGAAGAIAWPAWLVHEGRAVWCLATWTAPVAALVLAAGWRAAGRPAFALALPDGGSVKALLYGAVPAMRPWIGVGLIVTGLLAVTEHAVSDLCQVQTWNTEVLSLVQSWNAPGLLLGWPMFSLAAMLLVAALPFRRAIRSLLEDLTGLKAAEELISVRRRAGRIAGAAATIAAAGILLLPWAILGAELTDWAALGRTWGSFPREWPHGLRYATGAGLISLWMAFGIDLWLTVAKSRLGRIAAWIVVALAACAAIAPPAVVGDSFVAAYLRWPGLSNSWLIVSLATAARYAIIPIIGLRVAAAGNAELSRMAAVDGADRWSAWWYVRLPLSWSTALPCAAIVALLSLTEVPASQLVRPAGVESVALALFNHIHYGRNAEIVAMSLYVMAFIALVVAAIHLTSASRGAKKG